MMRQLVVCGVRGERHGSVDIGGLARRAAKVNRRRGSRTATRGDRGKVLGDEERTVLVLEGK